MKARWLVLFFSFFFLTGCDQGLKVQELQWSKTGDYLALSTENKILFFDGNDPYTLSPFIVEPVASPDFSWSPLSNKLVFTDSQNKGWDLVTFNIESQEKNWLTQDLAKDFLPRYLNAEEILFYSDRKGVIAPWRYQISTQRVDAQKEERLPPLPEEGLSDDELSKISISKFKEGSFIKGTYKEKKWKWKEPLLELRLPRWAPDNQRCAFVAHNPEIMKDDFLWVLDFENKTSKWVPILPQHLLSFADYFSKKGEWEKAFLYDRQFLETYPDNKNVPAAYLRKAYYYLHVQFDLARVESALNQIIERFSNTEGGQNARFWLGITYALKSEREKARNEFKAYLEVSEGGNKSRYEEVRNFILILKDKNTSDKSIYSFFQSVVHEEGGRDDAALLGYLTVLKSNPKNDLGIIALKSGARLSVEKGKNKKALKLWDKLILNAQKSDDREEGKLNYAMLLEKQLNKPDKAAKIYLKVADPYRALALKQLFYLNQEVFFDYSKSELIGDTFLKIYPESKDWSAVYDDLEQLKKYRRRSILDKELSLFYKAKFYEKEEKSAQAIKTYEEILSQTKMNRLKRSCYEKIAEIAGNSLEDDVKSVKAALSYLTTFEKEEAARPEKDFLNRNLFEPSLKIIQSEQNEKLDRLLQAFIKKYPDNQYRFLVDLLFVLTSFAQEKWSDVEKGTLSFLNEGKKESLTEQSYFENETEEVQELAAVMALTACAQQEKWDEALNWTNRYYVSDWKNLVRRHRQWIDLYRLTHPKELKELLKADLLIQSEISFFIPDARKKSFTLLEKLVFEQTQSNLKATAILLLADQIMDDARNNRENVSKIREKLYQLVKILNQEHPGSVWGGKLALKLAKFDSEDAFYVLALSTYDKVIELFRNKELEDEALWLKADLYLNRLDQSNEAVKWFELLKNKENSSVWKRKALLALGKVFSNRKDDFKKSVSTFKKLIDQSPRSPEAGEARFELGELYFGSLGQPQKALPLFKEIVKGKAKQDDELEWKIQLIEAGKKAVKIWKQIEALEVKTDFAKGNKLFEKLINQSNSEKFKIQTFNRWASFIQESEQTAPLIQLYRQRLDYSLTQSEWASLFESIGEEIETGSSPEKWQRLLAEWAKNQKISQENQSKITLLRAKLALKNGNKRKAEKFLKPWLREKSIPKEIVRHYWLAREKD